MYRLTLILVALLIGFHAAHAQTDGPIKGGVLNGKAIILPKPVYPIELSGTGEKGIVGMDVVIDEEGSVISAVPHFLTDEEKIRVGEAKEPVHPLLVEAARTAVMEAKFSPTLLSGVPVKVSGMIVYNFTGEPATTPSSDSGVRPLKVSGGVLNGKATSLPKPDYPPAARAVYAEGPVTVEIEIDENGDIASASAIAGHPLLRSAAVAAARKAKFSPTLLRGEPVRVSGVLTYNFVAPPRRQ